MGLVIFLLLAVSLSNISHAESYVFNPIQILWPRSATSSLRDEGLDCLSWRLAVETNNLQGWRLAPQSCKDYLGDYMQGKGEQYRHDCEEVAAAAIDYAKSFKPAVDGKDVWVFDIDETTLSNLGYYNRSDVQFGTLRSDKFYEWVNEGKADAVPGILNLYNKLLSLGFKTVFLTALSDKYKDIRENNLKKVGYNNWTELIFRAQTEGGRSYKATKRSELVDEGYRIVGNVGDQWSDLLGSNAGSRTFKVPNPMYYV